MLFSGLRYNALKQSRRFATHAFQDATENTTPKWLEAHYLNYKDKWQIYEYSYGYSQTHKAAGLMGKICEEHTDFSTAVSLLSAFEKTSLEQNLETVPNDASDDYMHVSEAESIIASQKFSLRQKIFGRSF